MRRETVGALCGVVGALAAGCGGRADSTKPSPPAAAPPPVVGGAEAGSGGNAASGDCEELAPRPRACTVSFTVTVLPILWSGTCGSTSCHGGINPPSAPRIDPPSAAATYESLVTFVMSTGQPYVTTTGVVADSAMSCNLRGTCGVRMPLGGILPQEDIELLEEWLVCGAPLN